MKTFDSYTTPELRDLCNEINIPVTMAQDRSQIITIMKQFPSFDHLKPVAGHQIMAVHDHALREYRKVTQNLDKVFHDVLSYLDLDYRICVTPHYHYDEGLVVSIHSPFASRTIEETTQEVDGVTFKVSCSDLPVGLIDRIIKRIKLVDKALKVK